MRKLCARWVPHGLTATQTEARRVFASDMLKRCSTNTTIRLKEIVTGDETWAYYYDPLTRLQSMEWVTPNQPRLSKVRPPRSIRKTMLILFFYHAGVVSRTKLVPMPGCKSDNALFYTSECLQKLVRALHKKYPKSGTRRILLHHDNASSHTAALTKSFLKEKKLQLLPHPPYSPDLAPCDYYLFSE